MPLERLTLFSLIITVALAGCSAGTNPVAPSGGGQAETPDTLSDDIPGLRSGDRFVSGPAAPILPRGTRLTMLRGEGSHPSTFSKRRSPR